jgi:hypothetical protein
MRINFAFLSLILFAMFSCSDMDKDIKIKSENSNKEAHEIESVYKSFTDSSPNSFEPVLLEKKPEISYSYSDSLQTHDYSGSWWYFDADDEPDNLLFVGTGGAHLYFHLRLVLSSDSIVRDFPELLLDMPLVQNMETLKKESFYPPLVLTQIVVDDFDSDGKDEIFLTLDRNTFSVVSQELKEKGVTSRYVLVDFNDNEVELNNFSFHPYPYNS